MDILWNFAIQDLQTTAHALPKTILLHLQIEQELEVQLTKCRAKAKAADGGNYF